MNVELQELVADEEDVPTTPNGLRPPARCDLEWDDGETRLSLPPS